ncbi:Hypothetical predicted protein [Pelobates cultripes]|uniref:ABC1 atypical kinase-like domain-containing protein n=1 Tax=Pelobates cultripes TaxID=61616 RepID=A0AAD1W192_PELCU|nr:Hypothetical predicted protein [Pelobates cultripes]
MSLSALSLRIKLSCCTQRSSIYILLKWKHIAVQCQRCPLRLCKLQVLPKIAMICWGIKHVTTTALCDKLTPTELAGGIAVNYGADFGNRNPSDSILKKINFVIYLGIRACILILKFGPLVVFYPLTFLSATLSSLWLRILLKATETSGPACIKLGQWASTRRDIFSEEFCALFSKLHVKVTPHPWDYTERCLQRAFGNDWRHLLKFQSTDPVGSGCVAQVYKAYADLSRFRNVDIETPIESSDPNSAFEAWEVSRLAVILQHFWKWKHPHKEDEKQRVFVEGAFDINHELTGSLSEDSEEHNLTPVAIKVLHPGLSQRVRMDLVLMKKFSYLLGLIPGFKWLSLTEIVEEFEKLMTQQMDLRYEARNLELFQQKFERVGYIKFPSPLRPLVTRNILVETYEEGESLSVYLQDGEPSLLKKRIAEMGVDMLLKMVFLDNFVHADLHPGNILVQGAEQFNMSHMDQTTLVDMCDTLVVDVRPSRCPLRLVLLDTGIVAKLTENDLQNFHAVFTAVVLGQGDKVGELILHHARANQCSDEEGFKLQMAELVNDARNNTITLGKLQVAVLLSHVFRLLMTHKVKLESNFASIVFAILVLEGLGRSLNPEIDILEAARPLLIKKATSLI